MSISRSIRKIRLRLKPYGSRALHLHDQLEGQLSIEETHFLLTRARNMRTIVEIGSYRGKSCALLALGSAPNGHVTAIDPHLSTTGAGATNYNAIDERVFHETMTRHNVTDRVLHIVQTSHEARSHWPNDKPIDLLWIDGDHSYEGLTTDLTDWAPLVRPGGLLAAHDYTHRESVRDAWRDYFSIVDGWHASPDKPSRVRSIAWAARSMDHA